MYVSNFNFNHIRYVMDTLEPTILFLTYILIISSNLSVSYASMYVYIYLSILLHGNSF